ncbi:MAG TPA: BMP family ABC transporter substrate-binding protein, partial [Herbaspirillum sp.]|nr:BMP family ABC transporter substrate-binding protein [Herbaspirillum sp.]
DYYNERVGEVLAGTWKTSTTWLDLKDNAIDLKAFNANVPDAVKTLVAERKKTIIDGSAPIWKGPIKDNTGKEQIPKDTVADDGFLHGIKFYVEGVQGKVPG